MIVTIFHCKSKWQYENFTLLFSEFAFSSFYKMVKKTWSRLWKHWFRALFHKNFKYNTSYNNWFSSQHKKLEINWLVSTWWFGLQWVIHLPSLLSPIRPSVQEINAKNLATNTAKILKACLTILWTLDVTLMLERYLPTIPHLYRTMTKT